MERGEHNIHRYLKNNQKDTRRYSRFGCAARLRLSLQLPPIILKTKNLLLSFFIMKIIEKCAFAILKVHLLPRLDPPLEVDERRVVVVGRTASLAEVAAALARRGPHETSSLRPIPLLFLN